MPTLTGKTEYGKIVAKKLRNELVTRALANTNYRGDASVAIAVQIPVTPELSVRDYSKSTLSNNAPTADSNGWIPSVIDNDKMINVYLDGYDLNTLPYDDKADAMDRAAYALAKAEDTHFITVLQRAIEGKDKAGNTYTSTDPRYQKAGTIRALGQSEDIYTALVALYATQTKKGVPTTGRWLLATPDGLAAILDSNKAIRQGDLAQNIIEKGAVAMIAGYEVYTTAQLSGTATAAGASSATNILMIAGHPGYITRMDAFKVEPNWFDGNTDADIVGGVLLKGREVFSHDVTSPDAFVELVAAAS